MLLPLTSLLDGPHAQSRANLALSILRGTTIVHTIMDVAPPPASDRKQLQEQLLRVLGVALEE